MSGASSSAGDWGLAFDYDGFSNLVSQRVVKGAAPVLEVVHDLATNRILGPGYRYDAAGNLVMTPGLQMSYDLRNRLVTTSSSGNGQEWYAYDPKNLPIWRQTVNGEETLYLYDILKRRIGCYKLVADAKGNLSFSVLDNNVYFGDRMLYSRGQAVVLDRINSVRSWASAASGGRTTKYLPFGQELAPTLQDQDKFGSAMRSSSSGLDYAEQRPYSSILGRFLSPDPFLGSVRMDDPQTWNRFSFVENNPVNVTNPHGSFGDTRAGLPARRRKSLAESLFARLV